jgi:hypothetical protein
MNASTWTGDGVTPKAVVSNLAFQPDFLWLKQRSANNYHFLQNSIAGATKYLASNATDAESSGSSGGWIQSFDSTGYTTVTGASNSNNVNGSGITYVGWSWKAGGTAVSNTSGTITSQVSANTIAGFSVVTYTGLSSGVSTIGHGLGVAPSMYIVKSRSNADNWFVYHVSTGNTGKLNLNDTSAFGTVAIWNNTSPTSTVFTFNNSTVGSAQNYVAYCFAAVAGYSAFGSYTGNGSTDGPFVYTNMRSRFVMIKRTDSAGYDWVIYDTSRNTYNAVTLNLDPNSSAAETNTGSSGMDITSNGFKLRDGSLFWNASGGTYIYACFGENPLKFANAR